MKTPPPKTLFLIDGMGALVSALMLGVVLVQFEDFFGMPTQTLYWLAGAALVFATYSLSCHFRFMPNWPPFLRLIGIINLSYCAVTLGMVIYWWKELSIWGISYFAGEMAIVVGLATLEIKVASSRKAEG